MQRHIFNKKPICLISILCTVLLPLALPGCGGGGSGNGNNGGSAQTTTPLSVTATAPDGLTASLSESAAVIPVGESVTYILTLTNNTNQPIVFQAANGVATLVPAVGGTIAISNSSGPVFPGALPAIAGGGFGSSVTLAPGQSASGSSTPNFNFTPAGVYTAEATFDIQSNTGANESVTVGPLTVTAQ